ncbi:helix-turn-helix domain-containing protein [Streptococcus suis]
MNRLKKLRQEKKLSQKELADYLGINEKTISRWENGESTIKSDKAQKLADHFGVPVGYLLGYSENFFAEETKKLDKLLNQVLELDDGTPINRSDLINIVIETEEDEELIKIGKLKLISVVGQAPPEFWNSINNDVFRMLAIAPADYLPLISIWSLLSEKQREATLNLLQSFNFDDITD